MTNPAYTKQLDEKVQQTCQLMRAFSPPKPTIFASQDTHYRMRAEFRIWHENDDLFHIMFDPKTKRRIRIDAFPIASELINQLMPRLIEKLKKSDILRFKLFQIDYLSTLSGKLIVSLIYHKKLDEMWQNTARALCDELRQTGFDLQLIGRASKQKICFEHDFVDEMLRVKERTLIYRQVENSFTQPNAKININMLEWAIDKTAGSRGDLLELYCGNGNFSLALAQNFRRVLATEIAKPSVESAQYNIAVNQIDNVNILRMSAEEFTQALQGVRAFNRLKGISLDEYDCNTILVDPPRSGLDPDTLTLVQQYETIVYISCNPLTLQANLQTLIETHYIAHFAVFDQFPFTPHIECGMILQKRQ